MGEWSQICVNLRGVALILSHSTLHTVPAGHESQVTGHRSSETDQRYEFREGTVFPLVWDTYEFCGPGSKPDRGQGRQASEV